MEQQKREWIEIGPREDRIAPKHLGLDLAVLVRNLGYRDGQLPTQMINTASGMLETADELLEPRWLWLPTEVEFDSENRALLCAAPSAGRLSVGRIVAEQIQGIQAAAVFVATVGHRLEEASSRMFADGHGLEGYMLDAIGSAATEACGDALELAVSDSAAPLGWRITNRFSPGYCTWETGDQRALFGLLPDSPAGVVLSESSLMRPLKSISGIIGLGEAVERRPYICESCEMKDCHKRLVNSRP